MAINALRTCGIESPLSVHLNAGQLKGIGVINGSEHNDRTIEHEYLALSEHLPEYEAQDLTQFLRPAFDKVWEASGWPSGSPNYDRRSAK